MFENHSRNFGANQYVYPVLSRRAGGISIGVNLNPDKACNFQCVYCQVDRTECRSAGPVDRHRLAEELHRMVDWVTSGRIYQGPQFARTPPSLRRLNDFALSGDGEPTLCVNFEEVVSTCASVRRHRGLEEVKLVLITNASLLHQERVRRALGILDANYGEIWAKLDAGTEAYYQRVARTAVPWQRILDNLRDAATARPIVIQSLFMQIRGEPPSPEELDAYCDRLAEIVAAGGRIKLVQTYTVARAPSEGWVKPLADAQLDAIADRVRRRTGLVAAAYYA